MTQETFYPVPASLHFLGLFFCILAIDLRWNYRAKRASTNFSGDSGSRVMADHDPLVSIGMPVRNNERTLGLALRSILNQTYRHWELLLLDDGSTDDTPQDCPGLLRHRFPHQGLLRWELARAFDTIKPGDRHKPW